MKPRKHAELIKAWADGAEIQKRGLIGNHQFVPDWEDEKDPRWSNEYYEYRIKPEPKPDVVRYLKKSAIHGWYEVSQIELCKEGIVSATLKLTYDGETGELKSAEVLK